MTLPRLSTSMRWVIPILALALVLALTLANTNRAQADRDDSSCTLNGVGLSIGVFESDETTPVIPASIILDGQTIKYQATLSDLDGLNCAFEGGTWTLTTPDGVSHGLGTVPRIGGDIGVGSVDSSFISYVIDHSDETAGQIDSSTDYVNGEPHNASTHVGTVNADANAPRTVSHPDARISINPDDTNEVGDDHTFTVHVEKDEGSGFIDAAGVAVTITWPGGSGTPDTVNDTDCSSTDSNGECDVIINSAVAGIFNAHAAATVTVLTVPLDRETDGSGGNSDDAVKTYVDARISINPDDTNAVGDDHTFTVVVEENDGTGWAFAENESVTITWPGGSGTLDTVNDADCAATDVATAMTRSRPTSTPASASTQTALTPWGGSTSSPSMSKRMTAPAGLMPTVRPSPSPGLAAAGLPIPSTTTTATSPAPMSTVSVM